MRKMLVLAALSSLALIGCSDATNSNNDNMAVANSNQATPARNVGLSDDDLKFLKEAASGGMAEVDLGRLAAQKAKNPEVKKFGERMVTDHSKANEELKHLATRKGVTLPMEPMGEQKEEKDKLSKLSGADFDKEYMKLMVADHDTDVKAFQDEASGAKDPDVKNFAAKTLPTLQEHQKLAKDIYAKL